MKDLKDILSQDELDQMISETIYMADRPRTWEEYFDIHIKWFGPFGFLFHKKPKIDSDWHPSDDLYCYGFSLDLTTETYYYTYDWGKGFNFRVLGWGFEITRTGQ
jgi:hypothetical protein